MATTTKEAPSRTQGIGLREKYRALPAPSVTTFTTEGLIISSRLRKGSDKVESGSSGGGTCAPVVKKIYQAIQKQEQNLNRPKAAGLAQTN